MTWFGTNSDIECSLKATPNQFGRTTELRRENHIGCNNSRINLNAKNIKLNQRLSERVKFT